MYVPVTVFTDENDKRKETTKDSKKHQHHKEESIISEGNVPNCELDHHKKS